MSKSRLEWKVGLFVFIGLLLLAGLLIEFSKGTTFLRKTYTIRLRASNVGGLKVRSTVLMSGVQVGTVADIKLSPDGKSVSMTLRIYDEFVIHKDARFVIEQSGFLGDNYVSILPTENQGDIFRDGGEAHADAPFNLQEVARSAAGFIERIDETAQRLNEAIADVRRYVLNEQTLTNLSAAVSRLRGFSEEALATVDDLHTLIQTNRPALDAAGTNLVTFTVQLNQFGDGLNGIIATNGPTINELVKNVESSSVVLKNLLDDLQAGKGLAGSVLKNEDTASHLSQIASNLSVTTSNLNRLGLWGILWQHKPPRSNAPAATSRSLESPKKND